MTSGFTVMIEETATHRLVPEDGSSRGINVPYLAKDAELGPESRLKLPSGGWAQYDEIGTLKRVHVPEGWRIELWEDREEARELDLDAVLNRIGLRREQR